MRRLLFSVDSLFDTASNMLENLSLIMLGNLWAFAKEKPSMECRSLNFIRCVIYEKIQESLFFLSSSYKIDHKKKKLFSFLDHENDKSGNTIKF